MKICYCQEIGKEPQHLELWFCQIPLGSLMIPLLCGIISISPAKPPIIPQCAFIKLTGINSAWFSKFFHVTAFLDKNMKNYFRLGLNICILALWNFLNKILATKWNMILHSVASLEGGTRELPLPKSEKLIDKYYK